MGRPVACKVSMLRVLVWVSTTALFTFIEKLLAGTYLPLQIAPSVAHMLRAVLPGDWT